jgi:outer membrane lipoprotein-sorting protein
LTNLLPTRLIPGWALAACLLVLAHAALPAAAADLTAEQIVEKNAAARGGLEAWRKIRTMVWVGHVESANAPGSRLPFALEQKRPGKTRFEVTAETSQKSVRVYDGVHGWKVRPNSSGRPEVVPYTADELAFARDTRAIDGPLIDYAAKGATVTLGGVGEVDGRKAYRLNVRLPSGGTQRVWVDAETFLDVKMERETRNAQGQPVTVSVYFRNFQPFEGLQIPVTIETSAAAGGPTDKLVIDKLALNPELDDHRFAKPNVPGTRRNAVTVDTRAALGAQPAGRSTP